MSDDERPSAEKLDVLKKLQLTKWYPGMISFDDVMSIRVSNSKETMTWADLPWVMLERILMMQFDARQKTLQKCLNDNQMSLDSGSASESLSSFFFGDQHYSGCPDMLDVFLVVFLCCDPILKQKVVSKMYQCQLAVPFIIHFDGDHLMCSLWPLESIVLEWRQLKGDNKVQVCKEFLPRHPMHIISFVRLGRPSLSKGKLIDRMIESVHHNTFLETESSNPRKLSNGMIEICNYLPSGKTTDIFPQELFFFNLHGNAVQFPRQLKLLHAISSVVVVLVNVNVAEKDFKKDLQTIVKNKTCLLFSNPHINTCADLNQLIACLNFCEKLMGEKTKDSAIFASAGGAAKSVGRIVQDLQSKICSTMTLRDPPSSLSTLCATIKQHNILIDEEIDKADDIRNDVLNILDMKTRSVAEFKETLLPLQGVYWQEFASHQKQLHRISSWEDSEKVLTFGQDIREKMLKARSGQRKLFQNIPKMRMITDVLHQQKDNKSYLTYFIQWIRIELDAHSRHVLPTLYQKFEPTRMCSAGQKKKEQMIKDQESIEKELVDFSLGLEHMMREIGQMYEAMQSDEAVQDRWWSSGLPQIAARLLIYGVPMEIMDGDVGCVPLLWVTAVFDALKALIGNKRMFVLSVIGIQSSGKSTLLNAMFGLEFSVSAGRCTRGIYMQIIHVDDNKRRASEKVPFDYLVVVDSQGLRAPELANQNYDLDNEMATFVIGLANLTLINFKGESTTEMKDILQICMHAFLSMNRADEHKTMRAMFIHQNVSAVDADTQNQLTVKQLQEDLERVATEAAKREHLPSEDFSLNQIIGFHGSSDVFFLPDLLIGAPPMASVSPRYVEKVREMKAYIFSNIMCGHLQTLQLEDFKQRLDDLWKAIMELDFVFSFRNSLTIKAHLLLEKIFSKLCKIIEDAILKEQINLEQRIKNCVTKEQLQKEEKEAECFVSLNMYKTFDTCKKKLDNFFKGLEPEYKEILTNFRHHKEQSLKTCLEIRKQEMEKDLQILRDKQYDYLHKQIKFEKEVVQEANKLSRQNVSDQNLNSKFEEIWNINMEPVPDESSTASVKKKIESVLLHELIKENMPIDEILPYLRGYIANFKETSLQNKIDKDALQTCPFNTRGKVKLFSGPLTKVADFTNQLLCKFNDQLVGIIHDSRIFYLNCTNFVLDVLNVLQKHVDSSDESKRFGLNLKPYWRAIVAAHVVYCAVWEYRKKYGRDDGASDIVDERIQSQLKMIMLEELRTEMRNIPTETVIEKSFQPYCTGDVATEDIDAEYFRTKSVSFEKKYFKYVADDVKSKMTLLRNRLSEICSEEYNFHRVFGKQFIIKAKDTFSKESNPKFNYSPKGIVFFVAKATSMSVRYFEAMNLTHEIKYSSRSNLEHYKQRMTTMFLHLARGKGKCVAAAEFFTDVLKEQIMPEVDYHMFFAVFSGVSKTLKDSKYDLYVYILRELAENGSFKEYEKYIDDPNGYVLSWMRCHLNRHEFQSLSGSELRTRYSSKANQLVSETMKVVRQAVQHATGAVSKDKPFLENWCAELCDYVQRTPYDEEHVIYLKVQHIQKLKEFEVEDVQDLTDSILSKLKDIEKDLEKHYSCIDEYSVNWQGGDPVKRMFNAVWGCQELCPLCKEPCIMQDPAAEHTCLQHKPGIISGECLSVIPVISSCNTRVLPQYKNIDKEFMCKRNCPCLGVDSIAGTSKKHDGIPSTQSSMKGGFRDRTHSCKDYKKFFPQWNIMQKDNVMMSAYWKWFVRNFVRNLSRKYGFSTSKAKIPTAWCGINKEEAIKSLDQFSTYV